MKLMVFSIHDAAAEAYLPPMFFPTKGMAIRTFADAVNEEGSQFGRHAADYTLFYIGLFDESMGMMEPMTPDSMGNALQFLVKTDISLELEA